jgi:hypothetical protein
MYPAAPQTVQSGTVQALPAVIAPAGHEAENAPAAGTL